jgi:hypothetical protein
LLVAGCWLLDPSATRACFLRKKPGIVQPATKTSNEHSSHRPRRCFRISSVERRPISTEEATVGRFLCRAKSIANFQLKI